MESCFNDFIVDSCKLNIANLTNDKLFFILLLTMVFTSVVVSTIAFVIIIASKYDRIEIRDSFFLAIVNIFFLIRSIVWILFVMDLYDVENIFIIYNTPIVIAVFYTLYITVSSDTPSPHDMMYFIIPLSLELAKLTMSDHKHYPHHIDTFINVVLVDILLMTRMHKNSDEYSIKQTILNFFAFAMLITSILQSSVIPDITFWLSFGIMREWMTILCFAAMIFCCLK